MMLRMIACVAACLVALLPASAQQSVDRTDPYPGKSPAFLSVPLNVSFPITVVDEPVYGFTPSLEVAELPITVGRRAGAVAATVLRVLASQNRIKLGAPEDAMDAYFRPPSSDGDATLFRQAKELYDEATTYRTDRYDLSVDPLHLKWRLKLRLSRYLSAGSR